MNIMKWMDKLLFMYIKVV